MSQSPAWAPFNLSKLDDAGLKEVDPCHHGHWKEDDGEVGLGQGRDGNTRDKNMKQIKTQIKNKSNMIKNVFCIQIQTDSAKRNSESSLCFAPSHCAIAMECFSVCQCSDVLRGKALERTTRA